MTFLCLIVVQQVSPPPLWHLCDCAWLYLRQGISLLNKAFVWQRASGVSLAIMIFVCLIVVHQVSPSPLWHSCVWLWCIRYLPRRYGICVSVVHQISPSPLWHLWFWLLCSRYLPRRHDIRVSDCGASGISLAVMTFVCLIVVHQVSPSPLWHLCVLVCSREYHRGYHREYHRRYQREYHRGYLRGYHMAFAWFCEQHGISVAVMAPVGFWHAAWDLIRHYDMHAQSPNICMTVCNMGSHTSLSRVFRTVRDFACSMGLACH